MKQEQSLGFRVGVEGSNGAGRLEKVQELLLWLSSNELTSIHEDPGSIPGLAQWVWDPALLWLWCRMAAVARIRPLAWELPYASGVALESKKKKKEGRKEGKEGRKEGRKERKSTRRGPPYFSCGKAYKIEVIHLVSLEYSTGMLVL